MTELEADKALETKQVVSFQGHDKEVRGKIVAGPLKKLFLFESLDGSRAWLLPRDMSLVH